MAKKKYIETPQKMWELFEAYVKDVKDNPRTMSEFHGKDGEERIKPLERPLTFVGFENYVFSQGMNTELSHYYGNKDGRYYDYVGICSRIKGFIREDQIEGGMVGQYNSSITQRLNGLTDKTEVKTDSKVKISFK